MLSKRIMEHSKGYDFLFTKNLTKQLVHTRRQKDLGVSTAFIILLCVYCRLVWTLVFTEIRVPDPVSL